MSIPTTPLLPPWARPRAAELEAQWATDPRWAGVERTYSAADVLRLRATARDAVRAIVRRVDDALLRADRIALAEAGKGETDWTAALVADVERGPGGHVVTYEHARALIGTGAPEIHLSDRRRAPAATGTMVVSSSQHVRDLDAARLAADVAGVATTIVARTEARAATLLTTDADDRDREFVIGPRTREGFHRIRSGLDVAINRGLAYAPHADGVELVTPHLDPAEARHFAVAVRTRFPHVRLSCAWAPSDGSARPHEFNDYDVESFRRELIALGYAVRSPDSLHSRDHSSSTKEEQFA